MQQTTKAGPDNAPGHELASVSPGPGVQADGQAGAGRVGTLFYLCTAGEVRVLTFASADEGALEELLAGRPTRTLRGEAAAAELVAAARAIAGGEVGLGEEPGGNAGRVTAALTPRETEVLTLVARGCTSEEGAISLGIAECTVRFHLKNIYAKLGLSCRAEAAAWAVRHGLG